jgi:predicted DNA-binding transcriptional regulator AlpA
LDKEISMEEPKGRWLGRSSAASYIGAGISTLDHLRVAGDGPPFVKFGSRVMYDRVDLDAYMESRKRTSTSDANMAA